LARPKACLARQTFVPKLQTLHPDRNTFHSAVKTLHPAVKTFVPALQINDFLLQKSLFVRGLLCSIKKVKFFWIFGGSIHSI